jgi:alkylation response protein AidB-like acyl-CoA dehydrogenase
VSADGLRHEPQASLDPTVPLHRVSFDAAEVASLAEPDIAGDLIARLTALSGLLVSAEAIGAAAHLLGLARQYASERKQFGRTIGSNQALRHLLADLHVRQASGWSTVLYAAAALDDEIAGALQTASVAKAYVARAAREVAHGSMQVFGGIAFTAEHPAHRFLRRIVVREQQFGDAAHHEREIGRQLAEGVGARQPAAPRVLAG